MKNAGNAGVILVSFGSEINALTDAMLETMAAAFAKLKQTVIWKIKGKCEKISSFFSKINVKYSENKYSAYICLKGFLWTYFRGWGGGGENSYYWKEFCICIQSYS